MLIEIKIKQTGVNRCTVFFVKNGLKAYENMTIEEAQAFLTISQKLDFAGGRGNFFISESDYQHLLDGTWRSHTNKHRVACNINALDGQYCTHFRKPCTSNCEYNKFQL